MSWILEEMILREDVVWVPSDPGAGPVAGPSSSGFLLEPAWRPLLDGFRRPRRIVEAVVEFSEERDLDADSTLDEVFPILERLIAAGLLRPVTARGVPSPAATGGLLGASRDFVDACLFSDPQLAAPGFPKASLTFGSAGLAYGLYHVARAREDPTLLERAENRIREAWESRHDEGAFYGSAPGLGERVLGRVSPYHSATGVLAVQALVSRERGDSSTRRAAVSGFVEASRGPCEKIDLTLGEAGVLLGSALLVDALGPQAPGELLHLGRETVRGLRRRSDDLPPMREDRSIAYLGLAHGWGGLLYALLAWSRVTGDSLPETAEQRLAELAELGESSGRGLCWPRRLGSAEPPRYLPSWCNGAAGLVHLWALAYRLSGEERYLELAERSAWNTWEDGDPSLTSLCCGLSGRAYGLLAFYKATGETRWLERARRLASAAMRTDEASGQGLLHSLYKGRLGTAVLLADLEEPDSASMPFFEVS